MHLPTTLRDLSIALAFTVAGCYADGQVGYRMTYTAPAPELVYVSPGVQVVADLDVPVFLVDGVYWRYNGGVWYRSRLYSGGWTVATRVPVVVRRIDRPAVYARYRATPHVHGKAAVRDKRMKRPAAPPRATPSSRSAVVRDHRRS